MTAVRDIPFGRPWITDDDRAAVARVLDGPILTHGPEGDAFEREFEAFMGGGHAVTTSSCMAALHLACLHFGFGPGADILVPAQTHTATAHAVEWTGARPVFVDCDPTTGNVTAAALEAALTPMTRGILVVHFVGIPCDMPAIAALARQRNLVLIEDCALALGARRDGTHVGLFGDAGCFSFYPVKHITTGEGGMFVSRRREPVDAVRRLRAFGVDRTHQQRTRPGMYEVPELGLNYRMGEMQAALGRTQLRRIDESLARRKRNFEILRGRLSAHARVLDGAGNSHYCLSAIVPGGRDEIVVKLKEAGIGTSIYYPHPVPRMEYYRKKYGYAEERFRQAEAVSDRGIALPVGPHLSDEDVEHVAETTARILQEMRA